MYGNAKSSSLCCAETLLTAFPIALNVYAPLILIMASLGKVCSRLCTATTRSHARALLGTQQPYFRGTPWQGLRHIAASPCAAHANQPERQQLPPTSPADDRPTTGNGASTSQPTGDNNVVITLPTMLTLARVAAIPVLIAGGVVAIGRRYSAGLACLPPRAPVASL